MTDDNATQEGLDAAEEEIDEEPAEGAGPAAEPDEDVEPADEQPTAADEAEEEPATDEDAGPTLDDDVMSDEEADLLIPVEDYLGAADDNGDDDDGADLETDTAETTLEIYLEDGDGESVAAEDVILELLDQETDIEYTIDQEIEDGVAEPRPRKRHERWSDARASMQYLSHTTRALRSYGSQTRGVVDERWLRSPRWRAVAYTRCR